MPCLQNRGTIPARVHGVGRRTLAIRREADLVRAAARSDEWVLPPALGTPDCLFAQPTWTLQSLTQTDAASTRTQGH